MKTIKLRTFILATSAATSLLFFGGSYLLIDQLFQKMIYQEASQNANTTAQLTFNSMFELMSTGWTRDQLESFLEALSHATKDSSLNVQIYRSETVESLFGTIPQPSLDNLIQTTINSATPNDVVADGIMRHVYPLVAEEKCLGCHVNAQVGQVLGAIEVRRDMEALISQSRQEFFFLSIMAIPVALLLAGFAVSFVQQRISRPLEEVRNSIRHVNHVGDLRQISLPSHDTVYLTEFAQLFSSLEDLVSRLRTVAVDKDILEFEIGLLEKFVITSEVVKDWREYVHQLLNDINQVVNTHFLFSIFKVDDEQFDLEVFWNTTPSQSTRDMVEHYIHIAMDEHTYFGGATDIQIRHHSRGNDPMPISLTEDEIKLQIKSFLVDKPKIGGIVGIGVHASVLADPTLRLVMDSILSTLLNVVGSVRAIYKYTQDLEYYATRDPLTNIYNQRAFWELFHYEQSRAQRHGYHFALLVIDLDNFKMINDGFGHSFGDRYLQVFAESLGEVLRTGDIFGRYGGDEFVVILPESSLEEACVIAQRVLTAIAEFQIQAPDDSAIRATASVGLAMFPEHAEEPRDLFMFADNMMYKAKKAGKNQIAVPNDEDIVDVFRNISQQSVMVMQAIEEHRIVPFLQPIMNVKTREIEAYEVLSRIELNGKIIGADEFVEIAERLGVIHKIDLQVLEKVLDEFSSHEYSGKFFLNLSPRSLIINEFCMGLRRIVNNSGIAPERIVFEITERDTIKNLSVLENLLLDFKAEGFGLAIDDFGSGFSSFHYLRRFPIDYLKIEGDFIVSMLNNPKDKAFVQSMQSLAEQLGIKTVAEFVEDQSVLDEVAALGITFAQGYFVGEPDPHPLPQECWIPKEEPALID